MKLSKDEILKKLQLRNLNDGYSKLADIPHYSLLKDIDKGAKRIANAIRNKESLKLCADYDGDGILSCATAISFFKMLDIHLNGRYQIDLQKGMVFLLKL